MPYFTSLGLWGTSVTRLNPLEVHLTHWGQVTHICFIIGSDNGLSPGRRQAIFWTNAGILLIGPLGTNFSEISSEIHTFSFKKMHLKTSAKWRPFCLSLTVLNKYVWEMLATHWIFSLLLLAGTSSHNRYTHYEYEVIFNNPRDHFVNGPSQWEMMLHCNVISHWLGANTKWSLQPITFQGSTLIFSSTCP